MNSRLGQMIRAGVPVWQRRTLPGLLVIAGVVLLRAMGGLQFLESV